MPAPGAIPRFAAIGLVVAVLVAAAEARARDTAAPKLTCKPCLEYRPNEDFEIVVEIKDDSKLFEPKVIYRSPASGAWRTRALVSDKDGHTYRVQIPASELSTVVEYFAEVFDVAGNGPSRCGDQDQPRQALPNAAAKLCGGDGGSAQGPFGLVAPTNRAKPAADTPGSTTGLSATDPMTPTPAPGGGVCGGNPTPFYCEPWVWAVAGGVVLASVGTTIAVLALRDGGDSIPGLATVQVTAPAPPAP